MWPAHASGMEEDSQVVMLEAGESPASTLDSLHAQVHAFGGAVGGAGAVVVEDLVAPALEGVAEGADLWHLVALARRWPCAAASWRGPRARSGRCRGWTPWPARRRGARRGDRRAARPSNMRSWPRSSRHSAPFKGSLLIR